MSERCFTQPFLATAAVIEQDGKILLAKQGKAHARGLWDLPAGWVDLGEDPRDTVVREAKEETGLDFTPTHLLGIYSRLKPSEARPGTIIQPVNLVFRGTWSGEPSCDGEEVLEHGWFSEQEIQAMHQDTLRSPNIKPIIKDYFSGIAYSLDAVRHHPDPIQPW